MGVIPTVLTAFVEIQ